MFESVVLPAPFSPEQRVDLSRGSLEVDVVVRDDSGKPLRDSRSATAGEEGGEAGASPPSVVSALGATDDALDEPGHSVEVLDGHALALGDPQLALLVVQRSRANS